MIVRSAPAILYAGILAVSAMPGSDLGILPGWVAVVGHAAAYASLAGLIRLSGVGPGATVLSCTIGAILNELEQLVVPGRAADVTDITVDLLGAVVGLLLVLPLRQPRVFEGSGSSAV